MKRKWGSPGPSTASASVDDGGSSSGAEFEVFLSFRGPDTRLTFTDSLYHTLVKAGIRVFRDNEEIRQGEKIGDELLHAIKSSKIYVPIFSRNYASSVWCLRELTHMMDCSSKAKDKMILPIFYDVDPDDVKLRTRLYLDSLEKHEGKFGRDVLQWKEALTQVAKIRGLGLKNRGHGEIINTIMEEVVTKLMKRGRNLPDYLVGIHDQVEIVVDLLNEGSHDFHYLVIHGMGGIGKTTLASAIFNRISNQFEGYSFLSDVRESAQHGRIIDLQKQMLSKILQGRSPEIHNSIDVGINIIRERFRHKKVLLVIDDVDKWDQLSKLAGKSDWFGPGSKIIVTTRDINFLPIKEEEEEGSFQAHSKEFEIYNMKEMDSSHALELFSRHALGMDFPPPQYEDISCKITYKTGGLPLALEVIGSSLFGKNKTIWKDTLKKLHSMPKQEVFVKLKISYDMLDDAQREIFLDIACYFIGKDRLYPFYMWKASGYFPKNDLLVLTRMSLIKIKEDDRLWMHDQLRDLGREIIRLEDSDPGKRSRLWMPDNALNVVQRKQASEKIVALKLTTGLFEVQNFTSEEFSKLPNLRFMELDGGNLIGDFKNLLSKLTWFSWSHCPSKLEAKNLCLEKLVVLELSAIVFKDWEGWEQCMVSNNLKVIHIIPELILARIPDLSKCKNLKRLVLHDCPTMPMIDGSLSKLEHLKHLEIKGLFLSRTNKCSFLPSTFGGLRSLSTLDIESMNVEEIHHSIGEMMHLKYLSFNACAFRKVPDSIGKLKLLVELNLRYTQITELPHCIGDLKKLTKLSLSWTRIKQLPNSIGGLESLIELYLANSGITELPTSIGNLKKLEILSLQGSAIRELPETIGMLESLKELNALMCGNLEGEIPNEIGALSILRMLNLGMSKISRLPISMNRLSHLQRLILYKCDKLEQISDLPMSLECLRFPSHLLWTAIDLSYLTNLVELNISKCTPQLSEFGDRTPNTEWIKRLSKLEYLTLDMGNVTSFLIDLATPSPLRSLTVTWIDHQSSIVLPSNLSALTLGLELKKIDISCGSSNELPERLSGFPILKGLEELRVTNCPSLKEIQGVEKLESLEYIHISSCKSLKRFSGLSELKKLQQLDLFGCPLLDLPDLPLQTLVNHQRWVTFPLVSSSTIFSFSFSSQAIFNLFLLEIIHAMHACSP